MSVRGRVEKTRHDGQEMMGLWPKSLATFISSIISPSYFIGKNEQEDDSTRILQSVANNKKRKQTGSKEMMITVRNSKEKVGDMYKNTD